MGFPLPATRPYRYGAAWRVPRLGVVYGYNQIRGVARNGTLLRAHDGVDVEVPNGTRVMAPFAGVVVNPAALWKPWDPERYGNVVVIRSTEATSRGYYALMAHLSRRDVRVSATASPAGPSSVVRARPATRSEPRPTSTSRLRAPVPHRLRVRRCPAQPRRVRPAAHRCTRPIRGAERCAP